MLRPQNTPFSVERRLHLCDGAAERHGYRVVRAPVEVGESGDVRLDARSCIDPCGNDRRFADHTANVGYVVDVHDALFGPTRSIVSGVPQRHDDRHDFQGSRFARSLNDCSKSGRVPPCRSTSPPSIQPLPGPEATATSASGDLPSRAQYVVVGGGVVGTSIAYHLATLGATEVVLLERKQLTSGTTWHAAGEVVSGGASEDPLWMARYSARAVHQAGRGDRPLDRLQAGAGTCSWRPRIVATRRTAARLLTALGRA